ncbi:MAG: sulfatase-like hydrolase/transferase [Armatimonadota bacterium]|nr:sulfatase-like hydrolase/transferase [Armatimonadota bacterium]
MDRTQSRRQATANDCFLGCYGDPLAHTPTLDKIARESVLYERCYAQPVCAPSRFTLISVIRSYNGADCEGK